MDNAKIDALGEGETIEAINIDGNYYCFKCINGILREIKSYTEQQEQTEECFGFKWNKRETYEGKSINNATKTWLLEKYFDGNELLMERYIKPGCMFLDAGCGAGFSVIALMGGYINNINYCGVDISNAVDVAKKRFDERELKGNFIQSDLQHLPFDEPTFDVIFSEGVLHHTDSTKNAILNLSKLLKLDGFMMFYVYAKKSPIREFCDDYIREYLRDKSDEQAWNELIPLTELGKTLGDLNIEIQVPSDIPYLGIKKGTINIQRLFYWNIFKAFYRPEYSLEEMNHINFDWYRPLNCHRQSPEEVVEWCKEAGLTIERLHVEEAGITVIAKKLKE